ncbi:MAG: alpha-xylosidase [Treponema sp.]|jgi:alpha-D-xyloside xylohydrolase|nr:alpha-xylosidase [Treponema sp.]
MQFTEGLWQDKCGVKLHRAEELWRYEVKKDSIRCLVPTRKIHTLHDTTGMTCLHFTFSAPGEDMTAVKMEHFTGIVERGPGFRLDTDKDLHPEIQDEEETLTLSSGRMKVVIWKTGLFRYGFFFDGALLTSGGNRGTSYVTGIDYEADRASDYNGRPAPKNHMAETYMREVLSLDVGEYIYGLGERFGPLVKNGQSVDIWNRDGGSCSDQAYKNIPFYLSGKNYGVLVNTPSRVEFEIGSINVRNVEFSAGGECLEYIVIGAENPKSVLSKYTALTGRPPVPPAWSFGLWLSTSWIPDSNEKITMEFIDGMKERGIPLSVFHFDARWMDDFNCCDFIWSKRFGDAKVLLKKIHDRGVKVCVWMNPYVSQESVLFDEGKKNGYFIKKKNGDIWQTDVWMSGMAVVDFTNPAARTWYMGRLEELVDMGVDVFKTDFGERIPVDVAYWDGSDPEKMHNYYPYLYNSAVFHMLKQKKGENEACVFARSATAGTQQFPVHWGGDNDASYVSMAESLRGGLSFCQSGFGFWAHDISGFQGTATPDLYKRWAAFGLLSTHSRLHGQESYRVPWLFDEESSRVLAHFTRLKCSLMPYLFSQAVSVHETGVPAMRAMMLDFPGDPACGTLDRQYMLGDDLLVSPVFREDGFAEFYVPGGGVWVNYLDGECFDGGRWYRRRYDYFSLPLLVRPGAIIASGMVDTSPVYDYINGVCFHVFDIQDGASAECTVYDSRRIRSLKAAVSRGGNLLEISCPGGGEWSVWSCLYRIRSAEGADLREAPEGSFGKGCAGGIIAVPHPGVVKIQLEIEADI